MNTVPDKTLFKNTALRIVYLLDMSFYLVQKCEDNTNIEGKGSYHKNSNFPKIGENCMYHKYRNFPLGIQDPQRQIKLCICIGSPDQLGTDWNPRGTTKILPRGITKIPSPYRDALVGNLTQRKKIGSI